MLNIKPSPGGTILLVVPCTAFLKEALLLHPRLLWQSYGSAMRGLWLTPDIRQIVVCTSLLSASIVDGLLSEAAGQDSVSSVHICPSFDEIQTWASSVSQTEEDYAVSSRKEHMGPNGHEKHSLLVFGADTTKLPENILRHPALLFWG